LTKIANAASAAPRRIVMRPIVEGGGCTRPARRLHGRNRVVPVLVARRHDDRRVFAVLTYRRRMPDDHIDESMQVLMDAPDGTSPYVFSQFSS